MTRDEAYMIGFLTRCADEGLTPEETRQRVKAASGFLTAGNLATAGLGSAALLGGGALGVGYLGGHIAGSLASDPMGAEEVKAKDLANVYHLLALRAKQDRKPLVPR